MVCATTLIVCLFGSNGLNAADSGAGQRVFESRCASCHRLQDYASKSQAQLEDTLKGIVAGTIDHPKRLALSAGEVMDLAAYISDNKAR
jgi:mono/diheme cytochrome c family protein